MANGKEHEARNVMGEPSIYQEHNPTVLVLFGATGNLTREKIIPALFELYRKNFLPPLFQIVGFSRQKLSPEDFRARAAEIVAKLPHGKTRAGKSFVSLFSYVPGYFERRGGYHALAEFLGFRDHEWRACSNKLFYLAVPPRYYKNIMRHLAASGLTAPCSPDEGWTRVAVEKPFGKNARTAEALDQMLGKLFREEQIYRIDHYLGKETVQNILAFRFSNSFLEPAWNNRHIESIRISLWETAGMEGRGDFYDGVGALRDVGQNHILQLLALFMMEHPGSFDASAIRTARAAILRALRRMAPEEVDSGTVRAQYRGFLRERGVSPTSRTETYFQIRAELDSLRWAGVPILLESGKRLREAKAEVAVTFRHPVPCFCPVPPGRHYHNVLRYRIQPQEGIFTSFLVKRPGETMALEEKDFSFDYHRAYPRRAFLDAYERLFLGAIRGDQTLFVSTDEILASWKFIDPIIARWREGTPKLLSYPPRVDPARIAERKNKKKGAERKELVLVGLGKMGLNMGARLAERGWRVRAFDRNESKRAAARAGGMKPYPTLRAALAAAKKPRIVWLMIPAKALGGTFPVDELLFGEGGLARMLKKEDVAIDGGNSFFKDTMRRARQLRRLGVAFADAGVSGGPAGARHGASLMLGGDANIIRRLDPLFRDLAVPGGYAHFGKSGAGHFVKMVHNGIEYGMMQAIAEGFTLLHRSEFHINVKKAAEVYNQRSVIESRLTEWLRRAYETYGEELEGISGAVAHTGEGEWTVKTAKQLKILVPVIEAALRFRIRSAKKPSYTGRILTALRNQFGGHGVTRPQFTRDAVSDWLSERSLSPRRAPRRPREPRTSPAHNLKKNKY